MISIPIKIDKDSLCNIEEQSGQAEEAVGEISRYEDLRYLTTSESVWRALELPMYEAQAPVVPEAVDEISRFEDSRYLMNDVRPVGEHERRYNVPAQQPENCEMSAV